MNLKTERKIKFWLGILTKIAFVILIVFKIYDFVTSRIVENESTKITDDIVEKDTLGQVVGIRRDRPSDDTALSQKDSVNDTTDILEKKDRIAKINPNSVSIIIYDLEGVDHEITNHLENTLFQKYDLGPPPIKTPAKKITLLRGDFSRVNGIKTQYIVAGEVHYDFKQSKLSSNTISCQINLRFNTYDTATGSKKRELSKSIQVNGIGFSQEEAKANAIEKI